MKKVIIYTDGACSKNPGPGGWAFIIKYGEHIFESLIDNNSWSPEIFPNAWKITQ